MIKFSIPDCELDKTLIEQAAKNDAIIILPEYNSVDWLIKSYDDYIEESGLKYSNGEEIKIMTYHDYINSNLVNDNNKLVILSPYDIILDVLNANDDNLIFIENNEYW